MRNRFKLQCVLSAIIWIASTNGFSQGTPQKSAESVVINVVRRDVGASNEKIRVLASCLGKVQIFPKEPPVEMTPERFVKWMKEELKSDEVGIVGAVNSAVPLTVVEPALNFKNVQEFFVIEIPEKALVEYLALQAKLRKEDPQAYELSPGPKNYWDVFMYFEMGTVGACEIFAPTRFLVIP